METVCDLRGLIDFVGAGCPDPVGPVSLEVQIWDKRFVRATKSDKTADIATRGPVVMDDKALMGPIQALVDSSVSFVISYGSDDQAYTLEWTIGDS